MIDYMQNPVIDIFGNKYWYNSKGKLHREDGPARECINGDKYWYKEGNLHRLDGPAIDCANGDKYWYKKGKHHRLDGPAVEYAGGDKVYFISINNNIHIFYDPQTNHSFIHQNNDEKIKLEISSPEEFFDFYKNNLYKVYLTFK